MSMQKIKIIILSLFSMKSVTVLKFLSVLLIILSVALMIINPQKEQNLSEGFFTPIVAFEFIKTPAEVTHFFEVKNVYDYKSKMLLGNAVDYAFMLVYSLLLFGVSRYFNSIRKSAVFHISTVLCLFMLLGDALENLQIYQIIQASATTNINTNLYLLNIFTWLKWASIASVFGLFATYYFRQRGILNKLCGSAGIVSLILAVVAFFLQKGLWYELFALSVVCNFLLTVIYVFSRKRALQLALNKK